MTPILLVLLSSLACRSEDPVDPGTPQDTDDTGTVDTGEEIPENIYTIDEDLRWDEDITLSTVWYIAEGATLSIAPGVTVSFQSGAGIVVDGAIVAEGSDNASGVSFVSANTLSTGNYGVSVGGKENASTLDNATFDGINLRLEGSASTGLTSAAFRDSTLGIYSRAGGFTLSNTTFSENRRDNQAAVVARDVGQLDVSDCSFNEVGHGIIYDGTSEAATLNISASTFEKVTRAALVGNLQEFSHKVSVTDVQVSQTSSQGFAVYGAELTLKNVTVSDTLSYGVYGNAESTINWTGGSVERTVGQGIYSGGSLNLTDITVNDIDSSGIYAGEEGSTLTRVTITDTEGYGVYASGPLTVIDSSVSQARSHSIYAAYGDLTVSGTTVEQGNGIGIYAAYANLSATNVQVSNTLSYGLHTAYGDLSVTDVTVENSDNSAIHANRGALTATNTQVNGALGVGLYSYLGDLTATNVTVENVESHGMYANDAGIIADTVSVNDARGYGMISSYGNIDLTDVVISNTLSSGVYANRGNVTVNAGTTGVSISDVDGSGVQANTGSIIATGLTVARARNHGAYASYGSVMLSESSFTDLGGFGAYASYDDISVSSTSFNTFVNTAVYVYQGDATVTETEMTGVGERGIYVNRGDLEVSETTITAPVYQGILVSQGDASITNVTISDSSDRGIYLTEGDATLDGVRVVDLDADGSSAQSYGIDVRGHITANNVLVDQGESIGLYAESGDLSYSTFSNNDNRGVQFYGEGVASTITYTEITDNSHYGFLGNVSGSNLVDISYANISGNFYYGVYGAQSVDNCYVADNQEESGADTTEEGSLDGDMDVNSTQLYSVDAVSNPQSAEVSGTGSTLSPS